MNSWTLIVGKTTGRIIKKRFFFFCRYMKRQRNEDILCEVYCGFQVKCLEKNNSSQKVTLAWRNSQVITAVVNCHERKQRQKLLLDKTFYLFSNYPNECPKLRRKLLSCTSAKNEKKSRKL